MSPEAEALLVQLAIEAEHGEEVRRRDRPRRVAEAAVLRPLPPGDIAETGIKQEAGCL